MIQQNESEIDCLDDIENTYNGDPLPPLLGSYDTEFNGLTYTVASTRNMPLDPQLQSMITRIAGFNNNNNGQVVHGLSHKSPQQEFGLNCENATLRSSEKEIFDSSMTSSPQIYDRSSFSQPSSPYALRHRFLRESKNRMSDAQLVHERRKRLTNMREGLISTKSNDKSPVDTVGNKDFGNREVAFGPVWLDGKNSGVEVSKRTTKLRDSLEILPNKEKDFEILRSRGPTRRTVGEFHYQQQNYEKEQENHSTRRRTIAPITSLDDRIRQRQSSPCQVRSHTLPEEEIRQKLEGSPILTRAATLPESISEEQGSTPEPDSPTSPFSSLIQEERVVTQSGSLPDLPRAISPDNIPILSRSTTAAEMNPMKASFRKMRSKLGLKQQQQPTSTPVKATRYSMTLDRSTSPEYMQKSPEDVQQVSSEPRRRTGSFGSKMLRRAKSAVSRHSKKSIKNGEVPNEKEIPPDYPRGLLQKQTSLNDNLINRVSASPNDYSIMVQNQSDGSFFDGSALEEQSPTVKSNNPCHTVIIQGDIYRRKRLVWTRTWGVLTADRLLTLYKSKESFEISRAEWQLQSCRNSNKSMTLRSFGSVNSLNGISSVVNLKSGCEIENPIQGKKGTIFQLVPHSYQTFSEQGVTATLPIDSEWRTPHKAVHLMCKNNDEFLYWVNAFLQLNTEDRAKRVRKAKNLVLSSANSTPSARRSDIGYSQQNISDTGSPYFDRVSAVEMESSKYVTVRNDVLHRSSKQLEIPAVKDMTFPRKISDVDLDQIKFIDEDEEITSLETRKTSDFEDNGKHKQNNSKTLDEQRNKEGRRGGEINRDEKFADEFPKTSKLEKATNKNVNSDDSDSSEKELKKCAKTEKLDSRKAKVVSRNENTKQRYDTSGYSPEVRDNTNNNSKYTSQVRLFVNDRNHDCPSISDSARQNERTSRPLTNNQSNSREKEKGATRKKEYSESSSRDPQTMLSFHDDKGRGAGSSVVSVYIDGSTEKDNISGGVNSAKDKHNKSDNILSSECENYTETVSERSNSGAEIEISKESERYEAYNTKTVINDSYINPAISKNDRLSIKQYKSRSGVNKQKSLRQKVLRKLGPRPSLSNSSPDINASVENEEYQNSLDIHSDDEETSPSGVKLRRNTAFRGDLRLSSPVLVRCLSEGDLLDSGEDEVDGKDMRTFKNVRKLSQDTFMETYGVVPRIKEGKDVRKQKRHTTYDINKNDLPGFTLFVDESDYMTGNQRRSSTSGSSSSEGLSYQASLSTSEPTAVPSRDVTKATLSKSKSDDPQAVIRRPKSTGSDSNDSRNSGGKESSRNSWIASLTPHFTRKGNKEPSSTNTKTTQAARRAVYKIPASNLNAATHKGYLDRRTKKKQWERFWCVFQDSCLYCYNSPQSESTQDAIVLRGYDVIADVTNMNRSRFPFRLERKGSPTLHFSSENHRDFLLWVGTLEKENRNVLATATDREVLVNSVKTTANISRVDNQQAIDEDDKSKTNDDSKPVEPFQMQKENLLREVLAHQHKFIEEEKLLHIKNSNAQLSVMSDYTTRRVSKDQVNVKYSKAKEDEEMKTLKCLTHLNKRRNSAQLKVDQITKQLAPKSGRKRRENPQQFADMESKLKQLQERLSMVDQEIHEKHASRQDAFEKIKQRRDLELLILEQQESLAIIHKHQANMKRKAFAQQTQSEEMNDRLASIDEMSTISDSSSASSNSLVDSLSLSLMSTPRQKRADKTNNNLVSEDTTHFLASDQKEDNSVDGASGTDSTNTSTLSEETQRSPVSKTRSADATTDKKSEVDPSVLAYIEDFQLFSKQKLAKLNSN